MNTVRDPTNWRAADGFRAVAIDIRKCVWCGEGFVRVRLQNRPVTFCSAECHDEQDAAYKADYEMRRKQS